jgi:hypothetical protein
MSLKTKVRASEHRRLAETIDAQSARIEQQDAQIATALKTIDQLRARRNPRKVSLAKSARPKSDIVEVALGDIHGNQADPAAMAAVIEDLRSIRPDRLILGGDIINCGGFLAEHHTLGYVAETEDSYMDDIEQTNYWLDQLLEAAQPKEVLYLDGNHENRLERWVLSQKLAHQKDIETLRRQFAPEHVLNLEARGIKRYRRDVVYDPECGVPGWIRVDKMYFAHEVSGSTNAGPDALRRAGANICFFHTHRATYHPTHLPGVGVIAAWNPGCLCRRQPFYMHTKPSGWTHGYLVRFISASTGHFQAVPITIADGVSYGGAIFHRD